MIHRETFSETWHRLCQRWSRNADFEEAELYLRYLNDTGMDTESFLEAARALWATSEFFPRPADFLLCRASREWRIVGNAIEAHSPPHHNGYGELETATPRARRAVSDLGGLQWMKELHQRDPIRARRLFFEVYELQVLEEAASVPTLEAQAPAPALASGGSRG